MGEQVFPKFDLYNNEDYNICLAKHLEWEKKHGEYYRSILCLKNCQNTGPKEQTITKAFENIKQFVTNSVEEVLEHKRCYLCVLPKGHSGKCNYIPHKSIFTHKTLEGKLQWIYSTEGNNDYIYKNRGPRIFPIKVPDSIEKLIKNKNIKLRCAIPLKCSSSPLMCAAAFIDYLTQIMSIPGVEYYIESNSKLLPMINELVIKHRVKLKQYYSSINRPLFDSKNSLICPVLREKILIENIINPDRCNSRAIQLGHCCPRSNREYTIRGFNVVVMTRDGNRIVGDYNFFEDEWLMILRRILSFFSTVNIEL